MNSFSHVSAVLLLLGYPNLIIILGFFITISKRFERLQTNTNIRTAKN